MDEDTRLKARELLLRSRIYRFVALIFAVFGLTIFIALYFKIARGNFLDVLRDIRLFVILLLPFLPACVMSWVAVRTETRFKTLMAPFTEMRAAPPPKAGHDGSDGP